MHIPGPPQPPIDLHISLDPETHRVSVGGTALQDKVLTLGLLEIAKEMVFIGTVRNTFLVEERRIDPATLIVKGSPS